MAEEPQPAENPPQPTAGEQKQEAAALSNLNTNSIDEDPSASKASNADQAALGSALSYLSVSDKAKVNGAGPKTEVKKIKVNEEDLKFLIEELEVSKKKATEMLQASGGNRMDAVKAFVIPAAKA